MSRRRMIALIGIMVVAGGIRVNQQTALRLKGYALGRQQQRVRALEHESLWLKAQVVGLQSPARLANVLTGRPRKLVARTTLASTPQRTRLAHASLSPARPLRFVAGRSELAVVSE